MHDRVFHHTHSHKLEDPERSQWLPPGEAIGHLQLTRGMKVADIGAGTGYFAIPIAEAVGPSGHVSAVDLQPEMIDLLRKKLDRPGAPANVSLHAGNAVRLPLPDAGADLAFYANVWHEFDNLHSVFREATRITNLDGRIAILDWRDDCPPPPGPPREHRISASSVMSFFRAKGCAEVFVTDIGKYSYLVTAVLHSPRR